MIVFWLTQWLDPSRPGHVIPSTRPFFRRRLGPWEWQHVLVATRSNRFVNDRSLIEWYGGFLKWGFNTKVVSWLMTWMIFASTVLGSLHMAHNLNAKKWVETIVNGSYYSAKLNATRLGLIKSLYSRRAKNCWSCLIHLVFPDPWPPGLWLDNWAWKPNIEEQNDPMESYICMCIYIYTYYITYCKIYTISRM